MHAEAKWQTTRTWQAQGFRVLGFLRFRAQGFRVLGGGEGFSGLGFRG